MPQFKAWTNEIEFLFSAPHLPVPTPWGLEKVNEWSLFCSPQAVIQGTGSPLPLFVEARESSKEKQTALALAATGGGVGCEGAQAGGPS